MWNSTDVVVMSVRNNYADDILFSSFQIFDVRNNVVDSRHIFFGKLQTHIDDKYIVFVFKDRHVPSYFFRAADGNDAQCFCGSRG